MSETGQRRQRRQIKKKRLVCGKPLVIWISAAAAAIALLITAAVLLFGGNAQKNLSDKDLAAVAPDSASAEIEAFEIPAAYAALQYPAMWQNDITYRFEEAGDIYCVAFSAPEGDEETDLFYVFFGDAEKIDSNVVGTLKSGSRTFDVSVYVCDIDRGEIWTDDEYSRVLAMQEDLNYLLDRLKENDAFSEI